jgi:cyanophycin synthetase
VHHIQVDNNRVAYVLKRNPVGVRGNGVLSIRALIDEENSVRKKALLWQRKMPLPSDEEAIEAVKQLEFSFDSAPPNGVWVPLRKLPNNTDGSRDEDLSSRIHPDNIALVLRATSLLGLSWASIDVISPDISIPWYQNGAVINEVNNAPMMGAGSTSKAAIPELLKNTLNDAGRIPIECYVGGDQAYAKACSRQQALASQGQGCVLITHFALEDPSGCSRLGSKEGLFKLTLGALLNKRAEALILVIQTDELLHTGLPVDRVSQVVWVDEKLVDREHAQPLTDQSIKALKDLLESALVEQKEGEI